MAGCGSVAPDSSGSRGLSSSEEDPASSLAGGLGFPEATLYEGEEEEEEEEENDDDDDEKACCEV